MSARIARLVNRARRRRERGLGGSRPYAIGDWPSTPDHWRAIPESEREADIVELTGGTVLLTWVDTLEGIEKKRRRRVEMQPDPDVPPLPLMGHP